MATTMAEKIEASLVAKLRPERMRVVNESHMHNVPAGSETHWNVIVVAPAFRDMALPVRHRTVHEALGPDLIRSIHALTMKTLTPEEWQDQGGEVTNPAPKCLGGDARRSS